MFVGTCRTLLILDRTEYRTDIFLALLIPYIFLVLPGQVFYVLR